MLARSHVKFGAAAGVVAVSAGLVPLADPQIAAIAGGLYLAGTLLPDLDAPGSTAGTAWIIGRPRLRFRTKVGKKLWRAARRVWPGSPWLAQLVQWWCLLVYRATAGPRDKDAGSGHRTFTHTAIGCATAGGVVAALLSQLPQPAAAVVVALIVGVVGHAWGQWWRWVVALPTALVAYATPLAEAWPVWWAAVALGCVAHCAGDGCSRSGVPFWWPRLRDGRRWWPVHVLPRRFRFITGGWGERIVLGVTYAVTAGLVWPATASASNSIG